MNSLALVALTLLSAERVEPAPLRLEVLVSPRFGEEAGARTIASASRLLFLYDDALAARLAFDESTTTRRVLGIAGRAARLAFIDVTLESFLKTFNHEVFGHGARAREFGQWPSYQFTVPLPWAYLLAPGQEHLGLTEGVAVGAVDRELPVHFGGVEVDGLGSHLTALRALRAGGRLHYSDAMGYVAGRISYFQRWANPELLGTLPSAGDLDAYAHFLNARFNRYGRASLIETSQRLRRAYVLNLADPMLWLAGYDVIVNYVGKGERWSLIPTLHVRGFELFGLLRFNLSPFGAEHLLDVVASNSALSVDVYARAVSTGFAPAVGLGARLTQWDVRPWLELGAALDVWVQPELLPEYRNAFDGRLLPGVSGMVEATWKPLHHWGLTGQLGAKSRGYVVGQAIDAGLFGLVGIVFFEGPAGARAERLSVTPAAPAQ